MAVTNDWIVANINNPNLDVYDLTTLGGMTTDNTLFKSKQEYLNSNFIKQNSMFQDDSGKFSLTKFDSFYNALALRWHLLQEDSYPKGLQLDYFSTRRNANSRVRETKFNIGPEYDPANGKMGNPDLVKMGISGWDKVDERTKSEAEIALSLKIFDPKTNKFLDYSPEDSSLFNSPVNFFKDIVFGDSLVLATYDKDEIDLYGIQHRKGERKLNDLGFYYYEKLNGRSPMNKDILSIGDILTKEDSVLNHLDFFDSDDLEKSAAGIVAKNVAFIAPMFSPISSYYYTALIAKEMTRALPMLYEVGTNLFGKESSAPEWVNFIAGKAEGYTSGSSVYSSEKVFSFENFANLLTDVALLWGQQKRIAELVQKAGGKPKALADAKARAKALFDSKAGGKLAGLAQVDESLVKLGAKLEDLWQFTTLGKICMEKAYEPVVEAMKAKALFGADLALIYMAIVSNTDVYSDMKAKGATNKEAAWVTLASTAGMFSVDKYLHIGETFFEGLNDETLAAARNIAKKEWDDAASSIYGSNPATLWTKGGSLGKRIGEKLGNYWESLKRHEFGSTMWQEGFAKAMTEGLEEVSEELVTDMSKGMYSALGDLGLYEKSVENPIDWDTAAERYGMSFLGGAAGGALFYGVELAQKGFHPKEDADMADFVRKGKADALRKEVMSIRDAGKAGSNTLSGLDYVRDTNGNLTWLSTDEITRSQNYIIADRIIDKINAIEATIVGNNADLDDDALFDHMVLTDLRYQQYKNAGKVTGYYDEYKKRLTALIKAEDDVKRANLTIDGTPDGLVIATDLLERHNPNEELKQQRIAKLLEKADAAKKALDDFLSGDTSLEYTRKLNFVLDPRLHLTFLGLDFRKFIKEKLGHDIDPENIDPKEMLNIQNEWFKLYQEVMNTDAVDKAFQAYLATELSILPALRELEELSKTYEDTLNKLLQIHELNEEENAYKFDFHEFLKSEGLSLYTMDSHLPDESEEQYEKRLDLSTLEARDAYIKRFLKVIDLNREILLKYVDKLNEILGLVDFHIDASTARIIILNMRTRMKEIIEVEKRYTKIIKGSFFDASPYYDIMLDLNSDLSNIEEVKLKLFVRHQAQILGQITNAVDKILQVLEGLGSINVKHEFVNHYDKMLDAAGIVTLQLNLNKFVQLVNNSIVSDDVGLFLADIKANLDDDSLFEYLTRKLANEEVDESGVATVSYDLSLDEVKNTLLKRVENLTDDIIVKGGVLLKSLSDIYQEFIEKYIDDSNFLVNMALEEGEEGVPYTIANLLEDLLNPESQAYKDLAKLNGNIPEDIVIAIMTAYGNGELKQFAFGNDSAVNILSGNLYMPDFDTPGKTVTLQKLAVEEYLNQTIKRIENNPLYKLKSKLQTTVKSPLEKILEGIIIQITPEDKAINVNQTLDAIYKYYLGVDNMNDFQLESAQEADIENVITALKMLECYIYACSTSPNGEHFFGQHSQINDWAKQHSADLTKEWEPLPLFDIRYATLLDLERAKLLVEALVWQRISARNAMNKTYRLTMTEKKVTKLHYEALKGISLKFTVDDKEYDVTQGIEFKSTLGDVQSENMLALFLAELGLYNNFLKILKDSGLSVAEVILRGELFASTIKSGRDIRTQRVSELSPELEALTDYHKILYVLSVLTDNPSDFYDLTITEAEDPQSKIAPITVQLDNSRLGEAAFSPLFREAFNLLADTYHIPQTRTGNTVHIDGVSGAGKTEVVLKYIKKRFKVPEENMLIVGPTDSQSFKLAKSLGASTIFNFDDTSETNIFKKILGDLWKDIQTQITDVFAKLYADYKRKIEPKDNYIGEYRVEGEFFDAVYYATPEGQYGTRIELHEDKFNFVDAYKQQFIFIDEAAYLNPVQIAILDLFARKRNGVLYLANDSNQGSYLYGNNLIENLGPSSIFAVRTSKMQESLRSSNIQMQQNNKKLNTLINLINAVFDYGTLELLEDILKRLPDLVKRLSFRVYNLEDDINGYLFGAKSSDFIPKLVKLQNQAKAQGKVISVGFIGKETSPTYYAMKAAGIEVYEPLSANPEPGRKFMLGLEFDYVVIDPIENLPDKPTPKYDFISKFIKPFNTLATRGKTAAIFLDDFSNLFAPQLLDLRKSEGFSISDLIDKFKRDYLESVNAIKGKLTPTGAKKEEEVIAKKTTETTTSEEEKKEPEKIVTPIEYLPHTTVKDLAEKEDEYSFEEEEEADEILAEFSAGTGLFAEANLVMPVINLEREDKNDKSSTWKPFDEATATSNVRRNLQAFVTTTNNSTKDGLKTYKEKAYYQEILSAILSYILYGGDVTTLVSKFPQLKGFDFAGGKLCLELRKVEENDYYGLSTSTIEKRNPDGTYTQVPIKDTFINGLYKFAIVYKVDAVIAGGTRGSLKRILAVFDICQMTDPKELMTKKRLNEIIAKASARISKAQAKLDKAIAQGKNALIVALQKNIQRDTLLKDTIEETAKKYNLLFTELAKKVENGEEAVVSLDPDDYVKHGVSRLVHRHSARRLGEHISIENIELNKRYVDGPHKGEYITNLDSFMDLDLRKVVSPVYLLGKQSDELKGIIDESVFGKAVVFVSNNTLLSRDELAERYIKLKLDPEHHTPEVRMIVLDNHGLSFSEIVYNRIQKSINGSTGSHSRKPYRMDVLGIRMFAAMWNFRAGLKAFNNAYETWKRDSGYDENRVQNILYAESLLFLLNRGKSILEQIKSDKEVPNFTKLLLDSIKNGGITQLLNRLQTTIADKEDIPSHIKAFIANGITNGTLVKDLENLIKFNLEICKDIPIFRLGYDFTSGKLGGYVRSFSISNSSRYSNGEYNMLAISSEAAKQFDFLLDLIFTQLITGDPVSSKLASYKGLGIKLLKEGGGELDAKDFIGDKELSKNMSGLIHTNDKVLKVDGYEIPDKQLFSFFPSAIADIVKGFYAYTQNPTEKVDGISSGGDLNFRNIDMNDNEVSFYFNLRSLEYNADLPNGVKKDHSNRLLWMFDFIFHGTTNNLESWHDIKANKESKRDKGYTYDAPFKYGFFIDPETNYVNLRDKILEVNINPLGDKAKFTLLEIGTHPAYFDVDVDSIPGGMAINIDRVLDKLRGTVVKKKETTTTEEGGMEGPAEELTFEIITQGHTFVTEGFREFFEANKDKYTKDDYDLLYEKYVKFVSNGITKILENGLSNITDLNRRFIDKHSAIFGRSILNITFDEDNDIIKLTLENGDIFNLFLEDDGKLYSSLTEATTGSLETENLDIPTLLEIEYVINTIQYTGSEQSMELLLINVKNSTGTDLFSFMCNLPNLAELITNDATINSVYEKLNKYRTEC